MSSIERGRLLVEERFPLEGMEKETVGESGVSTILSSCRGSPWGQFLLAFPGSSSIHRKELQRYGREENNG